MGILKKKLHMITPDLLVYYLVNIIKVTQTEGKMKLNIQMAVSQCGQCGTSLPPGARTCSACKAALA